MKGEAGGSEKQSPVRLVAGKVQVDQWELKENSKKPPKGDHIERADGEVPGNWPF